MWSCQVRGAWMARSGSIRSSHNLLLGHPRRRPLLPHRSLFESYPGSRTLPSRRLHQALSTSARAPLPHHSIRSSIYNDAHRVRPSSSRRREVVEPWKNHPAFSSSNTTRYLSACGKGEAGKSKVSPQDKNNNQGAINLSLTDNDRNHQSTNPPQLPTASSSSSIPSWDPQRLGPVDQRWLIRSDVQRVLERPVGQLSLDRDGPLLLQAYRQGAQIVAEQDANTTDGRARRRRQDKFRQLSLSQGPVLAQVVREGWAILDRLVAEIDYQQQQQQFASTDKESAAPLSVRQLQERLGIVPVGDKRAHPDLLSPWMLQTWRLIHVHEGRRGPLQKQLFTVDEVVERLPKWWDYGLFRYTCHLPTFVLEVLKIVHDDAQLVHAARKGHALVHQLLTVPPPLGPTTRMDEEGTTTADRQSDNTAVPSKRPPRYPDRFLFAYLIELWAKSGAPEAPERAMELLHSLQRLHRLYPRTPRYQLDAHVYAAVMHAWERVDVSKAGRHAAAMSASSPAVQAGPTVMNLLLEAQQEYEIPPTTILYDAVIRTLSRTASALPTFLAQQEQLQQAHSILQQRVDLWLHDRRQRQQNSQGGLSEPLRRGRQKQQHQEEWTRPHDWTYSPLIVAYVESGQLYEAVQLMATMQHLAWSEREPGVAPSDYSYNCLAQQFAKSWRSYSHQMKKRQQEEQQDGFMDLLDLRRHPRGSFGFTEWKKAEEQWLRRGPDDGMSQTPSLPFQNLRGALALLDRLSEELIASHGGALAPLQVPADTGHDGRISPVWPSRYAEDILQAWQYSQEEQLSGHFDGTVPDGRELMNRFLSYHAIGLFQPSTLIMEFILHQMGNNYHSEEAPLVAEALLDRIMDECDENNPSHEFFPNVNVFSQLVQLWADSGRSDAPDAVEEIYSRIVGWYQSQESSKFRPDALLFERIIQTWTKSNKGIESIAERTSRAREELESLGISTSSVFVEATLRSFANAGWVSEAKEIFFTVVEKYEASKDKQDCIIPSAMLQRWLIRAYNKAGQPERGEDVLVRMEEISQTAEDPNVSPDKLCYDEVIEGYASTRRPHQAESVLSRLLRKGQVTGMPGTCPDLQSWKTAFRAWALAASESRSMADKAADHASMLRQQLTSNETRNIKPDTDFFNLVLECYAEASNAQKFEKDASAIVALMESDRKSKISKPDATTYEHYLRILSRAGLADKAAAVLGRFGRLQQSGAIDAKPNSVHFNIALAGYAQEKNPPMLKVYTLLELMSRWKESESYDTDPDFETCRAVVSISSRCDSKSKQARTVLDMVSPEKLKSYQLLEADSATLQEIFNHWSKSSRKDARKRTKALVEWLRKSHMTHSNVYEAALESVSKHGTGHDAQVLFDDMIQKLADVGYPPMIPVSVYAWLAKAWGKSGQYEKSISILEDAVYNCTMGTVVGRLHRSHFHHTLLEMAENPTHEGADYALHIMNKMEELGASGWDQCNPDVDTFSIVMTVLVDSMVPDAEEKVEELFRQLADSSSTSNVSSKANVDVVAQLIKVHSLSSSPSSAERVEQLIRFMDSKDVDWESSSMEACTFIDEAISSSGNPHLDRYSMQQRWARVFSKRVHLLKKASTGK